MKHETKIKLLTIPFTSIHMSALFKFEYVAPVLADLSFPGLDW